MGRFLIPDKHKIFAKLNNVLYNNCAEEERSVYAASGQRRRIEGKLDDLNALYARDMKHQEYTLVID